MDIKRIVFNEKEHSFLKILCKTKFFDSFYIKAWKKESIELLCISANALIIKNNDKTLSIGPLTTSKMIYEFLLEAKSTNAPYEKMSKMALKLNVDVHQIALVCKNIWRNQSLKPFDKNIIYCFLMNAYLDREQKWLKNLVPHPLCFECCEHFESFKHLMLECKETKSLRDSLGISSWESILKHSLKLKLLVATILSSWTEEKGNYLLNSDEHGKVVLSSKETI